MHTFTMHTVTDPIENADHQYDRQLQRASRKDGE